MVVANPVAVHGIRKQARDKLLGLGKTPDEVAASLKKKGRKGRRGNVRDCPLARDIQEDFPDEDVEVSGDRITVDGCRLYRESKVSKLQVTEGVVMEPDDILPDHIWEFVERMDHGVYPDLIDRDAEEMCGYDEDDDDEDWEEDYEEDDLEDDDDDDWEDLDDDEDLDDEDDDDDYDEGVVD